MNILPIFFFSDFPIHNKAKLIQVIAFAVTTIHHTANIEQHQWRHMVSLRHNKGD